MNLDDVLARMQEAIEDDYLANVSERVGRELTDDERQVLLLIYAKVQIELNRLMDEELIHGSGTVNPLGIFAAKDSGVLASYSADKPKTRRDWWTPKVGGGIE